MKKHSKTHLLFLTFVFIFIQYSTAQNSDLETLLFELPDVVFHKIETADNFESTYELKIKQPIDHSDSTRGTFFQRVFLSHKGFDRPTVMITEGYGRSSNRINELTDLIDGNQLLIEHRYFGGSLPDTLDYTYLTIDQLTADLHHINTLFKNIYTGKWLATGRSKGGATTLFYRYLYPNDVDVSVNYVGPINTAFEEPRIYHFLDTVGSAECRAKIKSFQESLLKRRDEIMPLLKAYNLGVKANYTYHSIEKAFEFAVLEFPFSFWQYGYNCADIPADSVSDFEAVKYFLSISDITFFSDESINRLAPHFYQSANEMGYYSFKTSDFKDLLKELPTNRNPSAAFTPNKMVVPFDGTYLDAINEWLPAHGDSIIHIYGTLDTWSASAVPPSDEVDALWFFMLGKHHGNALIQNMTPAEKKKLTDTLERWLDMEIKD